MENFANTTLTNIDEMSSRTEKLPTSNLPIPNKSQSPNQRSQEKTKIYDLRERLMTFAKRVLQISKRLPNIPECEGIRKQLANASTSIGANFEEADGALTKKDFIHKTGIARKEAKETKYWLKVISGTYISESELKADTNEAEEIISILSSILKNSGHKVRY
ncbi:MAG: four helix bundle protein [bacterium]